MRLITDCVYIHKKNSFPVTYLNITHDIRSPSRLLLDKTRYLIISVSNPRLTEASRVRHGWLVTQFPARDPILMHVVASRIGYFPLKRKKERETTVRKTSDFGARWFLFQNRNTSTIWGIAWSRRTSSRGHGPWWWSCRPRPRRITRSSPRRSESTAARSRSTLSSPSCWGNTRR